MPLGHPALAASSPDPLASDDSENVAPRPAEPSNSAGLRQQLPLQVIMDICPMVNFFGFGLKARSFTKKEILFLFMEFFHLIKSTNATIYIGPIRTTKFLN